MKEFKNLSEAIGYHRSCHICGNRMVHGMKVDLDPAKPPVFKWNLSENVDSDTDDYLSINAYTNEITYFEQRRSTHDELIYGTSGMLLDRIRRYTPCTKNYKGTMYESIYVHCGTCRNFSYILQVIIDMVKNRLSGIFLNSEFITYNEEGHTHSVRNSYAASTTEYDYTVDPTSENDSTKRHISVPLIPLNLKKPAETVARIRKLTIFS